MQKSIEERELIVLDGLGVTIRGTYHKTRDDICGARSDAARPERIGLLFFNGLGATRASTGDSAVHWADLFAERGYPSFRIDLPGYGDSAGDAPSDLLEFINKGGYASSASTAIAELASRFNLSGVVIVGHCSGSVSAIYAAAASKECKGLVLMEPYFHLPQTSQPEFRKRLHFWAMQSRIGGLLSKVFDVLKQISLLLGGSIPKNTNVSLVRCWKTLISTGLPILVLKVPVRKGPGAKPKVGEFDFLKYVLELAGRKSRVTVCVAEGANHSFADNVGRRAVRQHTENWLNDFFPVKEKDRVAMHASCSAAAMTDHSVAIENNRCQDTICLGS